MTKRTTVSLSEDTKKKLDEFMEQKGQSYDEILQRVIHSASNLCAKRSATGGEVEEKPQVEVESDGK